MDEYHFWTVYYNATLSDGSIQEDYITVQARTLLEAHEQATKELAAYAGDLFIRAIEID